MLRLLQASGVLLLLARVARLARAVRRLKSRAVTRRLLRQTAAIAAALEAPDYRGLDRQPIKGVDGDGSVVDVCVTYSATGEALVMILDWDFGRYSVRLEPARAGALARRLQLAADVVLMEGA